MIMHITANGQHSLHRASYASVYNVPFVNREDGNGLRIGPSPALAVMAFYSHLMEGLQPTRATAVRSGSGDDIYLHEFTDGQRQLTWAYTASRGQASVDFGTEVERIDLFGNRVLGTAYRLNDVPRLFRVSQAEIEAALK